MQTITPETKVIISQREESINSLLVSQLAATGDADYCHKIGNEFYEAGLYETALNHYSAAVQLNPKDAGVLNHRGLTFYHLKRYEESLLDHTSAIELKPDAAFFYNRAIVLNVLDKAEAALTDLMQALKLDPWDNDIIKMMLRLRLEKKVDMPYFFNNLPLI